MVVCTGWLPLSNWRILVTSQSVVESSGRREREGGSLSLLPRSGHRNSPLSTVFRCLRLLRLRSGHRDHNIQIFTITPPPDITRESTWPLNLWSKCGARGPLPLPTYLRTSPSICSQSVLDVRVIFVAIRESWTSSSHSLLETLQSNLSNFKRLRQILYVEL